MIADNIWPDMLTGRPEHQQGYYRGKESGFEHLFLMPVAGWVEGGHGHAWKSAHAVNAHIHVRHGEN